MENVTAAEPNEAVHRRAPTIKDVAALSGVATSTVSRALSQPGRVNWATRERVEAAAAELGYVPTSVGRARSSVRTGFVALLVPDINNGFFLDLIRGTQRQLRASGFTQLLVDTEEDNDLEENYLDQMRGSVDGFILAASRLDDDKLAQAAARVPIVTINRTSPGVPTVLIDTARGVQQAVEHLFSLGHRDIAYMAGPVASWSDGRRWTALQETADTLGISIRRLGPYYPSQRSGAAAADAALNSGATACIAFNDLVAIGMLVRLKERGVDVPGELSVIGCDDVFGADFCNPPLTTLTAPIEQAGRVATDMLLSRLRPSTVSPRMQVELPTHLTIRASTGAAPHRK
ncbi:LacI family DNA-binding transcriptional regulator [Pseudarthrobacter sp. SSS035]|uniref:LacI family DNA-binding transcriptional regulator n=1 Tax=Pseudarthrobacter sp. SSS035 TaxID=2931399 RepID=UPI00200E009C|nr:LacI family DNA-binding transcriptional regulator [Pseudarthrobacter sp. SSS035]